MTTDGRSAVVSTRDPARAVRLASALRRAGCAAVGCATIRAALDRTADLVIVDAETEETLLAAVAAFRRRRRTPVLAVVPAGQRWLGASLLRAGADDFVTEPIDVDEVAARAIALLRRSEPDRVLRAGPLRVEPATGEVRLHGRTVNLTPREFDLIAFLLSHPARVWTRAELLERVWGFEHGDLSTVTVHVSHLRRKLGDDVRAGRFVVTVPQRGYRAGSGS